VGRAVGYAVGRAVGYAVGYAVGRVAIVESGVELTDMPRAPCAGGGAGDVPLPLRAQRTARPEPYAQEKRELRHRAT